MNRTNKTCRWWRLADVVHTAGGVRRKKFNIWPSRQKNNTSTHASDLLCCPFLAFTFLFTPRDAKVKYIKAILETGKLEINKGLSIYYDFLQYYRGGGGGSLPGPKFVLRNLWTAPKEASAFPLFQCVMFIGKLGRICKSGQIINFCQNNNPIYGPAINHQPGQHTPLVEFHPVRKSHKSNSWRKAPLSL